MCCFWVVGVTYDFYVASQINIILSSVELNTESCCKIGCQATLVCSQCSVCVFVCARTCGLCLLPCTEHWGPVNDVILRQLWSLPRLSKTWYTEAGVWTHGHIFRVKSSLANIISFLWLCSQSTFHTIYFSIFSQTNSNIVLCIWISQRYYDDKILRRHLQIYFFVLAMGLQRI